VAIRAFPQDDYVLAPIALYTGRSRLHPFHLRGGLSMYVTRHQLAAVLAVLATLMLAFTIWAVIGLSTGRGVQLGPIREAPAPSSR
jgi:hypothetical protein